VASAVSFTLWWIWSTPKRILLAMGCWGGQSTTANVLPKHGPSEDLADIKLEEGTQQNSKVSLKSGQPEAPVVTQVEVEEEAQQSSNVVPKLGPSEVPAVTELEEGSQQDSDVLPKHSSPEASAATQLKEGPQPDSNILPASSGASPVQLEEGVQHPK